MNWQKPLSRAGFLASMAAAGYAASDYASAGPLRRICSTVTRTVTNTVTQTVTVTTGSSPPPPVPLGTSLPTFVYGTPGNRPTATRTFYVDWDNGDDARSVAQAQVEGTPWKTLSKFIASAATAGDHCLIKDRSGQNSASPYTDANIVGYTPSSGVDHVIDNKDGTADDPIVVKAYPGHRPVIRCPAGSDPGVDIGRVLRLRNGSSYWVFDGLDFCYATGTGGNETVIYLTAAGGATTHHIEFWNCDIHGATDGSGIIFEDSGSFAVENSGLVNCSVYENDDWRGTGQQSHGVYMQGGNIGGDNFVLNCILRDHANGNGIQIKDGPLRFIMANCVMARNLITGSGATLDTRSYDTVVRNCISIDNHNGAWGWNGTDSSGLPVGSNNVLRKCIMNGNTNSSGQNFKNDVDQNQSWDWDGASNNSTNGSGADSLTDDPLLVDRDNNDFHLEAGSPAIGYGEEAYCPTFDFNEETRSQCDAGIFLFDSGSSARHWVWR